MSGVKLAIVLRDGSAVTVEARTGSSIMQAIVGAGISQGFALCGGACACGTCHIYIDPSDKHRLPPMSPDENDMLDIKEQRRETSRLSCQVAVTDALDGLRLTLAPEE
jgi:2Fe-2S ferredoxin